MIMVKIDLKDAHLTVPVHPSHRKFLRFVRKDVHYQFKVIPFGLSTALRTFTKRLRPIIFHLSKS